MKKMTRARKAVQRRKMQEKQEEISKRSKRRTNQYFNLSRKTRIVVFYIFISMLLAVTFPFATYQFLSAYKSKFLASATTQTKILCILGMASVGIMCAYCMYYMKHKKPYLEEVISCNYFVGILKKSGIRYYIWLTIFIFALDLVGAKGLLLDTFIHGFYNSPIHSLCENSNQDVFIISVGLFVPAVIGLISSLLRETLRRRKARRIGEFIDAAFLLSFNLLYGGGILPCIPVIFWNNAYYAKEEDSINGSIAVWVGLGFYLVISCIYSFKFDIALMWFIALTVIQYGLKFFGKFIPNPDGYVYL